MQMSSYVTLDQTVHPFTKTKRMFNEKEANSTANCIDGTCFFQYDPMVDQPQNQNQNQFQSQNQTTLKESFQNDIESRKKQLNNELNKDLKSYDNRPGQFNTPFNFVETDILDPNNPIDVNNAVPQDFTYNSYADWRAPTYNQWTRIHDDGCNEENRLRIGSKPMKYYVNQYNSPQVDPFMEYTMIGNQKQYNVRNEFERAMPTRLNPIYPSQVEPYLTTPFLGATNVDRVYSDTWSQMLFGSDLKSKKSQAGVSEIDYNRWDPGVHPETVQNAGQFVGMRVQQPIGQDGYYDYNAQNNVLFSNSATPYFGLSSRDLLHNLVDMTGC